MYQVIEANRCDSLVATVSIESQHIWFTLFVYLKSISNIIFLVFVVFHRLLILFRVLHPLAAGPHVLSHCHMKVPAHIRNWFIKHTDTGNHISKNTPVKRALY